MNSLHLDYPLGTGHDLLGSDVSTSTRRGVTACSAWSYWHSNAKFGQPGFCLYYCSQSLQDPVQLCIAHSECSESRPVTSSSSWLASRCWWCLQKKQQHCCINNVLFKIIFVDPIFEQTNYFFSQVTHWVYSNILNIFPWVAKCWTGPVSLQKVNGEKHVFCIWPWNC